MVEGDLLVGEHVGRRAQAGRVRQEEEAERPASGVGVERFHQCPERRESLQGDTFARLVKMTFIFHAPKSCLAAEPVRPSHQPMQNLSENGTT